MNNLAELPLNTFLKQLASDAPTPGGGGVAALCGALAAGLGNMVISFTTGRDTFAQHQETIDQLTLELTTLQQALTEAIDEDAQAFLHITSAYDLPKTTDSDKAARTEAIQAALKTATVVPYTVMTHCHQGLASCAQAIGKCNTNVITDLGAAAILFEAAAQCGLLNVRINTKYMKDRCFAEEMNDLAQDRLADCQALSQKIQAFCHDLII